MLLTHNTKSIKQNYNRRNTRAVRDREAATGLRWSGLVCISQSADAACCGDEADVRATTRGGDLPVAK